MPVAVKQARVAKNVGVGLPVMPECTREMQEQVFTAAFSQWLPQARVKGGVVLTLLLSRACTYGCAGCRRPCDRAECLQLEASVC